MRIHVGEFEGYTYVRNQAPHHCDGPEGRGANVNPQTAHGSWFELLRAANQDARCAEIDQVSAKARTGPEKANCDFAACPQPLCASARHFRCPLCDSKMCQ